MKSFGSVVFLTLTAFAGTAAGQAMVGYGLGAASAATTAAPAASLGKVIAKPWKNLETVSKTATSPSASTAMKAASVVTKPAVHYEDLGKIEDGISYADLLKRFGPPTLQITGDDGSCTFTYLRKDGHAELVLRDGKVGSVDIRRVETAAISH